MSVSAEMLRMCIPLIFEKAVAEPTFCVLYADLCTVLFRELDASPSFGSDNGKPVTFRRELLNTCQDQFEAMVVQRKELLSEGGADEGDRRHLRMRELGTIRLLAELYNKELLTQSIMRIVISDLLSRGCPGGNFDGDLIECLVQVRLLYYSLPFGGFLSGVLGCSLTAQLRVGCQSVPCINLSHASSSLARSVCLPSSSIRSS
jgi:hypothetical protein